MPAAAGDQRAPIQFEAGDSAEFGLESAVEFVNAENEPVVEIKQVVYRRPLTDAATAIQGGAVASVGGATIRADGLIARFQRSSSVLRTASGRSPGTGTRLPSPSGISASRARINLACSARTLSPHARSRSSSRAAR